MIIDPKLLRDSRLISEAAVLLPTLEDMQLGRNGCDKRPDVVRVNTLVERAPCGYCIAHQGINEQGLVVQQHISMVLTEIGFTLDTLMGKVT